MKKLNLKNHNHWLASLRRIAYKKKLKFDDEGVKKSMTKSDIDDIFDKNSTKDAFDEGLSPLEALENELECWEPY